MAQVTFNGIVLEHVSRSSKTNAANIYHSLIVYEKDQKYRRSVVEIKVNPDLLEQAVKLVGKVASINADMSQFDGRIDYHFKSVA